MEWDEYISTFIIAGVGAYLGAYIKKSAEYHAMNQNIRKITEDVETIKIDLNQDFGKYAIFYMP